MGILDFLNRPSEAEIKAELKEELLEELNFSLAEILKAAAKSSSDEVYDPDFEPEGGWDRWCAWAMHKGKIARQIRSLAKNIMSYEFAGEDEEALKLVKEMERKTHLKTKLILAVMDWLALGRCFIEPVWEIRKVGEQEKGRELIKVKVIAPETMTVFRDNEEDVRDLKEFLSKQDKYQGYAEDLKGGTGTGDNIIGFVQYWEKKDEGKAIFFKPDELIFIPRYPNRYWRDGISLLIENYDNIMNKLGTEKYQAIMLKRFVDHKHKFKVPKEWWGRLEDLQQKVYNKLKAGGDLWVPEGMEVEILETKGNPLATIRAQEHIEDQVTAGMGFADSFTESDSSNRSVGEVQLQFFERDLRPERKMFAEILEDNLIHPYVKAKLGEKAKPPTFNFEDLTPKDEVRWAQAMAAYLPYMTVGQLKRLFEDLGYPLAEDEEPQQPQTPQPGQEAPQGQEEEEPGEQEFTSQKNVPKDVLKEARPLREDFTTEIGRLREELLGLLGVE